MVSLCVVEDTELAGRGPRSSRGITNISATTISGGGIHGGPEEPPVI